MSTQDQHSNQSGLSYFLAERSGVVVVSWVGAMTKDGQPLDDCYNEVGAKTPSCVIFSLRDVPSIDRGALPQFLRLCKMIRDKGAVLQICSVHPQVRTFLDSQGALRKEELFNNIAEALQKFAAGSVGKPRAAA